jgi:hypothetical protein
LPTPVLHDPAMYPLRRTCKEVTALVIAREDRALGLIDRVALRMHMGMCAACPKFERQILVMRNAMKQWRNYESVDEGSTSPESQGGMTP